MDRNKLREITVSSMSTKGVPVNPHLPLIDFGQFRTSREIGEKIIVLYSLAGLANNAKADLLQKWLIDEGGWGLLSKQEQLLFSRDSLEPELLNELSWKQESLYMLCWAGNLAGLPNWPSEEMDISGIFDLIPPEKKVGEFLSNIKLRPAEEVVEQLDLYYCLHATIRHPELWDNSKSRLTLKAEVILERRQALEWIVSSPTGWDDISLDT